jgi:predicted RNase H-like nuclease (RuvC/YqgF family)
MTHPAEKHIDKLTAIIAKRDERITELFRCMREMQNAILQTDNPTSTYCCNNEAMERIAQMHERIAENKTMTERESAATNAKIHRLMDTIAEQRERIDLLSTELRRQIIADRDAEIEDDKFMAGWAWTSTSTKETRKKYAAKLKEYGL